MYDLIVRGGRVLDGLGHEARLTDVAVSGDRISHRRPAVGLRAWQALAKTIPGFLPVRGDHIILFGARHFDWAEPALLDQAGVRRVQNVGEMTQQLRVLGTRVDQTYLHIDLDVLDPTEATSNQWTPPDGIKLSTVLDAIAEFRKCANLVCLGIASYDPTVDQDGRALSAALEVIKASLA